MPDNVILITGASSGIGQATARLLAQHGLRVYGTSRSPSSSETVAGVEMVQLDVRSADAVNACIDAVISQAGRVDVLINNAGYVSAGAIEEFSLDEAEAQFETNFWGVVRMVKAVLPVMRRQGNGQIINVSSLAGLVGKPFWGFYNASKFALEGYSETLRHEVRPFNVNVSLVEPGAIKSNFWRARQLADARIDDYSPWRERVYQAETEMEEKASDARLVAARILHIVDSRSPRLRYRVGRDAAMVSQMRRLLPEPLFERVVRRIFHLDAENPKFATDLAATAYRPDTTRT
jgi:short-subunit dehydrogenase